MNFGILQDSFQQVQALHHSIQQRLVGVPVMSECVWLLGVPWEVQFQGESKVDSGNQLAARPTDTLWVCKVQISGLHALIGNLRAQAFCHSQGN